MDSAVCKRTTEAAEREEKVMTIRRRERSRAEEAKAAAPSSGQKLGSWSWRAVRIRRRDCCSAPLTSTSTLKAMTVTSRPTRATTTLMADARASVAVHRR
jgi:hypothetical protein